MVQQQQMAHRMRMGGGMPMQQPMMAPPMPGMPAPAPQMMAPAMPGMAAPTPMMHAQQNQMAMMQQQQQQAAMMRQRQMQMQQQ